MKIRVLCSDPRHPMQNWLQGWCQQQLAAGHDAAVLREWQRLDGEGDYLFLVYCQQAVAGDVRQRFRHSLVLQAPDGTHGGNLLSLVSGLVSDAYNLSLGLVKAVDGPGRGDIWQQRQLALDGTELHDEIQQRLFAAGLELMSWAVLNCDRQRSWPQPAPAAPTPPGLPHGHRIDPQRPLADSFDLLRMADPKRDPVHFEHRGRRYRLRIEAHPEPAAPPTGAPDCR